MRSAINTLLVFLSLMIAFLVSASARAATCPIGDTPSLLFPAGTSKVSSACVDDCEAVEGFNGQNTWTCNDEYCTGHFTTTGQTCTGEDGTDGTCTNGDCSSNGNGDGDNGGDGDCLGGVCAYPADIRSLHDAINYAEESSFNVAGEAATGLKRTQILAVRAGIVGANYTKRLLDKLDQVRTEHFADMDAALNTMMHKTNSIEGKMDSINTKVNTIATNSTSAATNLNDIKNKLDQLIDNTAPEEEPDCTPRPFPELPPPECIPRPSGVEQRLDGINNTLINNAVTDTIMSQEIKASIEGMKNDNNSRLDTLNESLGSLESSGDANSQAEVSAINGVGSKVDGLGGKLNGISQGIGDIKDLLSPGDYQERDAQGKVDFESLPLYGQTAIDELEAETKQLQQDYDDKVEEFRSLFSFDISKLNQGEYVDHSMTLTLANGAQANGKSGVFPALVDNSALIAAVILFLAAVIGSRFIF